ncbi:MAG: hypothetical protein HW414_1437 [Dehalococcoidia bacterium]|nr:hypothetical protein [Dehalococcoidia bacterium]
MRQIQIIGVLLLVLALTVGACAPKAAPAPIPTTTQVPQPIPTPTPQLSEWDNILAAARKEGAVTVYNVLGIELTQAMTAGMKQYGIKVDAIGGSGGELELKVITEQRAKANFADLLITGFTNNLNILEAGYGQPINVAALPALTEKDVWRIDPTQYEPTKSVLVYSTGITLSAIINTDLVRRSELSSWQDLLDPKWRDRMVMTDPRQGSGPSTSGLYIWMILGEDFWKKMAAQRITQQVRYDVVVNQVAYGEKPVGVFPASSRTVSAIKAGAPIQIVHFKEGTSHNVRSVGLIRNAPHPNASLVLLNWMFSKEGQAAIGRATDNFTIRKDITEDWLRIAELRSQTFTLVDPPNNIDLEGPRKGTEFAKKIFGAQ